MTELEFETLIKICESKNYDDKTLGLEILLNNKDIINPLWWRYLAWSTHFNLSDPINGTQSSDNDEIVRIWRNFKVNSDIKDISEWKPQGDYFVNNIKHDTTTEVKIV